MLKIDIPTLLLTLFAGFLLLSLQLWIALRGALRQPELRIWAQGSAAMLGGFGMLFLRPWLPPWVSALFGNGLFFLSVSLYSQAIFRYVLDHPLPRWYLPTVGLFCFTLLGMQHWEFQQRTAVISFMLALMLTPPTLLTLIRGWGHVAGAMRNVGLMMGVTCVAMYARGLDATLRPHQYTDLMEGDLGPGLVLLLTFLCLMAAGFGFVLACFERVALRMEELATHDGLTGCLNRVTTDTLIAHTLERGRREGSPLSFCLLDIDHFKRVNDEFGHQAGDMVLRGFAQAVRARLRASDVFGRMGGEEFALVLPATDGPGALRLGELVRAAIEQMTVTDEQGREIRVTVSIGIVVAASDSGLSATRLYMLADGALYRAKHCGRNRVMQADDSCDAAARPAGTIEKPSSETVAGNFS